MLQPIPVPALSDNYVWLVRAAHDDACLVVDPGEAEPVLATLEQKQLRPVAVLITHHHHDHVGGLAAIRERFPSIPVHGPAAEPVEGVDHLVRDGDQVDVPALETSFEVIATPGHTLGHVSFHGGGLLLCGDTLFAGGCGRVFEGSNEQMARSLDRLATLPGETLGCCGHEYTLANLAFARTVEPDNKALAQREQAAQARRDASEPTLPFELAEEWRTNPFLRCDQPDVRAAAERRAGRDVRDNADTFAILRDWKNRL